MRLTLLLLVAFVLHAGARGTAQTVTLSVSNMPLEKVCKEIERQTGYYFVYAKDMNKEGQLISVKVEHADIGETLRRIFDKLPYTYQVIDKVVVVNTAVKPIVETPKATDDPPFKASGVVLSDQGQPLSGASVSIKSSEKAVLTNTRGEFSIMVSGKDELIISYVGFAPQSVVVKDGTFLQIHMIVAKNQLDALVIKGYYATNNRLNTGNVSSVKAEDIQKQPVTDPLMALEGRVPGLYIQQTSGMPGAYSTILLRGQNSIPSDFKPVTLNDPLFIVDGVPFSSESLTDINIGGGAVGNPQAGRGQGISPFNILNPSDIESIDVLKDADATAIYGSRGSNGVILITTKRGKAGKTRVDADVFSGYAKPSRVYKLLNTEQYLQMRREAFKHDVERYGIIAGATTPNPNSDYDLTIWDTTRYTDWQKVLIGNKAHFSNAQLSISGGNSNTQFVISAGYANQGTVFPGNYGDVKASVHFNLTNTSTDQKFRIQMTTGYVNDNNNLPQTDFTHNILLPPNAPKLYDANGNINWELKNGRGTWNNPLAQTFKKAKAIADNILSNILLEYRIFRDLQIKSSFGYTKSEMNQSILTLGGSVIPPRPLNIFRNNSSATASLKTWIIEPQINYHHQIGKVTLEALLGSTFQESIRNANSQSVENFSSDIAVANPSAASVIYAPTYSYAQYKYNALFGRVSFNYEQKYLLNLTARRDGSSHFGPGKQFGNFGAIGAAWIFSKEKVIDENLPWLTFGKLRASYGTTGNDNLTDYQFLNTYSFTGITYQGATTLQPTQLTNPYYAWEKDTKLEGGLELGFLKDRILISISQYRNRTSNQLVGYPLPAITGFSTVQYNLPAVIQNTGTEIILKGEIVKTRDFNWNSTFNISIPRNKLVAYPGIQNSSFKYQYVIGQSLFVKYLYHYTGVDPQTGVYSYLSKNVNGRPENITDDYFLKSITQKYYGGWQNVFNYKGVQLDIFVQFVKQLGMNILGSLPSIPGSMNNQPSEVMTRWQRPNDKTNIQQFARYGPPSDAFGNIYISDGAVSDASFVRIKNVALSYQLPKRWVNKAHFQNAQIYFQAQNLFTISKYRGTDPETQSLSLPPLKVITIGARLSL